MSKIRRKKLTRGSILGVEHVYPPLVEASDPADADQVKVQWAPFRVNFNFPTLNDASGVPPGTPGSNVKGHPLSIPFTLPPLQREFDVSQVPGRSSSPIILDEISFSFDSMSERGPITMTVAPPMGSQFQPESKAVDRCAVDISILEKDQSLSEFVFSKEVTSFRVPGVALAGSKTERLNPVVVNNLGCVLSPYKMYLLQISAPDLYGYTTKLWMPNVNVSLRLRHPIVVGTPKASVQNAPDTFYAANSSSAIVPAVATDDINANGDGGVTKEITRIDEMFLSKLGGGMGKDTTVDEIRHMAACSGYEVIAVPLFQNPSVIHQKGYTRLPYGEHLTWKGAFDRRAIPIVHPITIHHVIAVANYHDPYPAGHAANPVAGLASSQMPQSPTLEFHVGVGIGRGIRADKFTYEQVAYHTWKPAGPTDPNIIDQCSPGSTWSYPLFETVCLPLEGSGGSGYRATGNPIFAGRGQGTRTDVGGHTPVTVGAEQFIEVRWFMKDTAGLDNPAIPAPAPVTDSDGDVFVGAGGHWVYLICEKRLSGQRS